jgi:hypothetical protein
MTFSGDTTMNKNDPRPPAVCRFPTTHWSCVVEAGDPDPDRSREALAELCGGYWYPLYAFIRRRGHSADSAGHPRLTRPSRNRNH